MNSVHVLESMLYLLLDSSGEGGEEEKEVD